LQRIELAPGYRICRVVNGCWQLSAGHARRPVDRAAALRRLHELVDLGRTTFDCADIYTGVEELLGELRAAVVARTGDREAVQIHTKCVPDRDALRGLRRDQIAALVERSLRRLRCERLDLVQLHWWDFEVPGFTEAAVWLDDLREQGKIRLVGVTNFDVGHLDALLGAGVRIASNQVQLSVLDRRPERLGGEDGCSAPATWPVPLLAYGSLAGGLLSERWLGAPPPAGEPENRSLVKYLLIAEEAGGWERLQQLLAVLSRLAQRRGVAIPDVAARWVLERRGVAAVVAGTSGRSQALDPFGFELTRDDLEEIARALPPSPPGEPYDLERRPGGRHAAIMRYDLNQQG
jgi:aryl-alcohol dehydrogenase-like predicted oxidoreductase